MSQAGRKAWQDSCSPTDNKSEHGRGSKKEFSKMKERRGNVHENKGPLWKTGEKRECYRKQRNLQVHGGNVVENKGGRCYVVGGRW